jgi:co-chaperonin GroES (HSP10)
MTNIRPYGALILVKENVVADTTTASGLVLTAGILDSHVRSGTVIHVGPGERSAFNNEIMTMDDIQKDMTVYYGRGSGTEIKDEDGQEYLLINYKNLLGFKDIHV